MKRMTRLTATIVTGLALAASVACGSSDTSANVQNVANEQTCIEKIDDPGELAQIREYAAKNGDTTQSVGDGSLCIIERGADGQPEQHIVSRDDNFSDYLMYSMLTGRGNSFAGAMVLSGNMDPMDAILLSHLSNIGSDGSYYHPYQRDPYGGYNRVERNVTNITKVTNIQYGNAPAVRYGSPQAKPPAKYKPLPLAPKATPGTTATLTKDATGKSVITPNKVTTSGTPNLPNASLKGSGSTATPAPAPKLAPPAPKPSGGSFSKPSSPRSSSTSPKRK